MPKKKNKIKIATEKEIQKAIVEIQDLLNLTSATCASIGFVIILYMAFQNFNIFLSLLVITLYIVAIATKFIAIQLPSVEVANEVKSKVKVITERPLTKEQLAEKELDEFLEKNAYEREKSERLLELSADYQITESSELTRALNDKYNFNRVVQLNQSTK